MFKSKISKANRAKLFITDVYNDGNDEHYRKMATLTKRVTEKIIRKIENNIIYQALDTSG